MQVRTRSSDGRMIDLTEETRRGPIAGEDIGV